MNASLAQNATALYTVCLYIYTRPTQFSRPDVLTKALQITGCQMEKSTQSIGLTYRITEVLQNPTLIH
jgi:uncharacterized membrane protein